MNREQLRRLLIERLCAAYAAVEDESAAHAGHAGARQGGGGHYRICVAAACFEGLGRLERHRRVYDALAAEMKTEIHALAIRALTPSEWNREKR